MDLGRACLCDLTSLVRNQKMMMVRSASCTPIPVGDVPEEEIVRRSVDGSPSRKFWLDTRLRTSLKFSKGVGPDVARSPVKRSESGRRGLGNQVRLERWGHKRGLRGEHACDTHTGWAMYW